MISRVCESFHCLPSQAVREDWILLQRVLDFRSAREAYRVAERDDADEMIDSNVGLRYWTNVLNFGEDVALTKLRNEREG